MKKFEINRLYEKAVKKWGITSQMNMAIEECAELIVVLAKHQRVQNNSTTDDVLEEMADVEIMLGQLKLIFNYDIRFTLPQTKFHAVKGQKLLRLKKRLEA